MADLWAAFGGESYGEFKDIDKITMFAGESGWRDDRYDIGTDATQTIASLRCSTLSAVFPTVRR